MWIVAVLFTVIDAAITVLLLLMTVHGGGHLRIVPPLFFVTSTGLTWILWALLRRRTWPWTRALAVFGSISILVWALGPMSFFAVSSYDVGHSDWRARKTTVSDLEDEPIAGPDGRTVGIRIRFHFTVPERGTYSVWPTLWGPHGLSFFVDTAKTDDGNYTGDFIPSRIYAAEFILRPALGASDGNQKLCNPDEPPAPFTISISDTAFGLPFFGGRAETTHGSYAPQEIVGVCRQRE